LIKKCSELCSTMLSNFRSVHKFCTDAELLSKTRIPCHHEAHEGHEEFENSYISISCFVPFATFVVKFSSDFLVAALPR
jgi:hypothetical protein